MPSVRTFEVAASQFEEFRFSLERRTRIRIEMIATEPVNILILDNDEMGEYEHGNLKTYEVTAAWNIKSQLDQEIVLDGGTWHLLIEGHKQKSKGRIKLSP